MRLRIDFAYDGSAYHGYAKQHDVPTVEGAITDSLARLLGQPVELTVAGRTDAGVHAWGQVAHFDIPLAALASSLAEKGLRQGRQNVATAAASVVNDSLELSGDLLKPSGTLARRASSFVKDGAPAAEQLDLLTTRLQRFLPADIAIHRLSPVPKTFDARFSALARTYRYHLADSRTPKNPLENGWVTTVPYLLDVEAMGRAAQVLLGKHEFLAFCKKPQPGATAIRTIFLLECARDASGKVVVQIKANAFCRNMVRSIVGALVEVGRHQRDQAWIEEALTSTQRFGQVMPAQGLVLVRVDYLPYSQL
jgi:tRNA pseudouridine38-40 synthase